MPLQIKIPAINNSFYPDEKRSVIKKRINEIYALYKSEIDLVSRLTNVPIPIITSFIYIESNANSKVISKANAVGLMQLIPSAASDILIIENKKGRLTDGEKDLLAQKLGDRFTKGILKARYLGDTVNVNGKYLNTFVTKEDLFDPLTNILIGCIYVGLLIDEHTEKGSVRLDKVVIRYNRGYFSDNRGKNLTGDIEAIAQRLPEESRNYVYKLLGKNGVLDSTLTSIA